jgi:hypothetical protein
MVLTRLRTEPATRAYAQRRRAQGKTNREIKRCVVRYVARQLYRLLETQPALDDIGASGGRCTAKLARLCSAGWPAESRSAACLAARRDV